MKDEFVIEGKTYISASRASKLSGYNPDYIGQLCRKNTLDCRMVGRTWFVNEESLKTHEATASVAPRGRMPLFQKDPESTQVEINKPEPSEVPVVGGVDSVPIIADVSATVSDTSSGDSLAYRSFHQDAVKFIDRVENKRQSRVFSQKLGFGVFAVIASIFIAPFFIGSGHSNVSTFFTDFNLKSQKNYFFSNGLASVASASKPNFGTINRTGVYSAAVFDSTSQVVGQGIDTVIENMYGGFSYLNEMFQSASGKFRSIVSNPGSGRRRLRAQVGVAVVPSTADPVVDERVKQYVRDSFSDETEVIPDATGMSGVLRPIFKNESDQEYVYVVVPLNETQR